MKNGIKYKTGKKKGFLFIKEKIYIEGQTTCVKMHQVKCYLISPLLACSFFKINLIQINEAFFLYIVLLPFTRVTRRN